jgi:hypothetical protein
MALAIFGWIDALLFSRCSSQGARHEYGGVAMRPSDDAGIAMDSLGFDRSLQSANGIE